MNRFRHVNPPDLATAIALLREPGAAAIAGGTDLLTRMKVGLFAPETLVNLKAIRELRGVREEGGRVRIGALTTLSELEDHSLIRERVPILSQAASLVGTPQLRSAGTVGGNLCQEVRCWYYRHPEVNCWLKGGVECYAEEGVGRHHAVFGESPCIAVHPSDLAPALVALGTLVRVVGPEVDGELPLEELYRLPEEGRRARTLLGPADLITEVILPECPAGSLGVFLKAMERATWSFALASVAVQLDLDGGRVQRGRLVLGGVAGKPWRPRDAEALLEGQELNEGLAERVGEAVQAGAKPRAPGAYKLPLMAGLVRQALEELAARR